MFHCGIEGEQSGVVKLNVEVHVGWHGDGYLELLNGAFFHQRKSEVEQVVTAMDCVVHHNDTVVFHAGVYHGKFADMVETPTVGALRGQLVDEGVLWHLDPAAVFTDGVYFVDGQILDIGVVDDEGFTFVSVGGKGTVA